MTTSTGSTPISVQNRSIAYGPSTSGSLDVVYCLNQLMQRLLLNPSSTLFVRRELQQNKKNIKWAKKKQFNSENTMINKLCWKYINETIKRGSINVANHTVERLLSN